MAMEIIYSTPRTDLHTCNHMHITEIPFLFLSMQIANIQNKNKSVSFIRHLSFLVNCTFDFFSSSLAVENREPKCKWKPTSQPVMLIERLKLLSYLGNKWVVERLSNSKMIEILEIYDERSTYIVCKLSAPEKSRQWPFEACCIA